MSRNNYEKTEFRVGDSLESIIEELTELWDHEKMINAQLLTENIALKKKLSERANSPPEDSDMFIVGDDTKPPREG